MENKNLFHISVVLFMLCAIIPTRAQQKIDTTFEGIHHVYMNLPKGSCRIISGGTKLRVQLSAESASKIVPLYSLKRENETLMIAEQSHPNSIQGYKPDWVITVPSHIEFFLQTGNGSVDVKNADVNLTADLGKGNVRLEQTTGTFCLSTTNGNILVDGLTINGNSQFKATKGDCIIKMKRSPEYDMTLASAAGNVKLNLNHLNFQGLLKVNLSRKSKFVSEIKSLQSKSFTKPGVNEVLTEKWIQLGQGSNQLLMSTDTGTITLTK